MEDWKPLVFIIHGAWHRPVHMGPLISKLNSKGYEAVCYQNPTSDHPPHAKRTPDSPESKYGLAEDAKAVSKNLSALIDGQGRRVFVVSHSWGGAVASEAVDERMSPTRRQEQGKKGGVVGLLYMCAYLIPKGDKISQWRYDGSGGLTPWSLHNPSTGMTDLQETDKYMYHDLDPPKAKHWASLTYPQTPISQESQTKEAFMHYPTTYLCAEDDQAIRIDFQERMVKAARERTEIREVRVKGSHSLYLSQTDRVCDEIIAALNWSCDVQR